VEVIQVKSQELIHDVKTHWDAVRGNCRLASLRAETSRSGRGSKVSLLRSRHRY
jgi:hypothetical protein